MVQSDERPPLKYNTLAQTARATEYIPVMNLIVAKAQAFPDPINPAEISATIKIVEDKFVKQYGKRLSMEEERWLLELLLQESFCKRIWLIRTLDVYYFMILTFRRS